MVLRRGVLDRLGPAVLIIEADWKENVVLPQGAEEPSPLFYAGARLGAAILSSRISGGPLGDRVLWVTACTRVLDKSGLWTLLVLKKIFEVLDSRFLLRGVLEANLWSDAGPHFRCNRFASGCATTLLLFLRKQPGGRLASLRVQWQCESHGKSEIADDFNNRRFGRHVVAAGHAAAACWCRGALFGCDATDITRCSCA